MEDRADERFHRSPPGSNSPRRVDLTNWSLGVYSAAPFPSAGARQLSSRLPETRGGATEALAARSYCSHACRRSRIDDHRPPQRRLTVVMPSENRSESGEEGEAQ